MARVTDDSYAGAENSQQQNVISLNGQEQIALPDVEFVKNSEILRDGQNLILETADGQSLVIEGYFNADPAPMLSAPDGSALTPDLVQSFVQTAGPAQYAQMGTISDASPIGAVQEISGSATVTRTDGSTETLMIGSPIYEGDVIETDAEGAVELIFIDETTFAVSQNAKLAIDEYVFDPETESGTQDFSVLRGLFVFTSGLVGRDDPDDVNIDTPMGSIGIRGTIIVGNTNTGEVTVMEGAIVVRAFNGTEITLSEQYDTARFEPLGSGVNYEGKMDASSFNANFDPLKPVAGNLFSSVADGQNNSNGPDGTEATQQDNSAASGESDTGASRNQDSPSGDAQQNDDAPASDDTAPLLQQPQSQDAPSTESDSPTEVQSDATSTDGTTTEGATNTTEGTTQNTAGTTTSTTTAQTTTQSSTNPTGSSTDASFDGNTYGTFDNTSGTFDSAALDTGATSGGTTVTGGTTTSGSTGTTGTTGGAGGTSQPTTTTSAPPTTTTATVSPQTPPAVLNDPPVGANANVGTVQASNGHTRLYSDGSSTTVNVNSFFTDPDGDALTYSIIARAQDGFAAPLGFVSLAGSSLSFLVPDSFTVSGADTQLQITVQATDTQGNTGSAIITLDLLGTDFGGTAGNDAALASGATGDTLNGFGGDDGFTFGHSGVTAFGGAGNDTFNFTGGAGSGNTVVGGGGVNTVDYSGHSGITTGLTVNLSTAEAVTVTHDAGTDTLWNIANLTGSAGDDTITGTVGANILNGGGGDDTLSGLAGNDIINGGAGDDTINGGSGDDNLSGGDGDDVFLIGSNDGNDTIDGGTSGETAGDLYNAAAVTDDMTVDVLGGAVSFGAQTDTISNIERFRTGSGNDSFVVGEINTGQNRYDGDTGVDQYDASSRTTNIDVDLTLGTNQITRGAGNDTVQNIERFIGTIAADTFRGDTNNNIFLGGAGNDTFYAINSGGNDDIDGGAGADIYDASAVTNNLSVTISAGNITSTQGAHTDTIENVENYIAGSGNDTINITAATIGLTYLSVGAGNDTLDLSALSAVNNATVDLDSGNLNITGGSSLGIAFFENVIGTAGADTINGDTDANIISGGAGNDMIEGRGGADTLDGGAGNDTLSYANSATAVTVDLSTNTVGGGDAAGDTISNFENVTGSANNDTIGGDAGANILNGGAGDDVLRGGAGADTIIGGTGIDTADYGSSTTGVNIDLGASTASGGDAAGDTLTGIENLNGSGFNDTLRGDNSNNVIEAAAGDDTLRGSGGSDVLDGGAGNDTADYSMFGFANAITLTLNGASDAIMGSAKGTDTLRNIENVIGSDGDDVVTGDANINRLEGGLGNDTLTEVGGNDSLFGQDGDDTLVMANDGSLVDGGTSSGGDTLELSGNNSFTLDEINVVDIECIDALADAGQQDIYLTVNNDILDNDTGDLSIYLDGADTLNITFETPGYYLFSGDLSTSGTATFTDGTYNITITYTGSASGRVTTDIAAASTVHLDLNAMSAGDGFRISDDIAEGFGYDMTVLGDTNRDGYTDLAFTKRDNATSDGRVFFVNGGTALSDIAVSGLTPESGLLSNAPSPNSQMHVVGGGDFNGDGIMDYIVSSEFASTVLTAGSGTAQVISGADNSVLTELSGLDTGDVAGRDISFIGDINGDGFDDVAVGVPRDDTAATDAGGVIIINGTNNPATEINILNTFGFEQLDTESAPAPSAMVSSGEYSFVLTGTNGFTVYNTLSPVTISSLGTTNNSELAGTNKSLAIHESGETVYALVDGDLVIVDVSTPASPTFNSTLNFYVDTSTGIAVHDNLLITISRDIDGGAAGTDGGYQIFDISDPNTPVALTSNIAMSNLYGADQIAISDDFAAIVTNDSVEFIDIRNPASPVHAGTYNPGNAIEVAISEDGAYTYVARASGEIEILDTSVPSSPSLVGTINGLGNINDISVNGDIIYAASQSNDTIYAISVADPASPFLVSATTTIDNPLAISYQDGVILAIGADDGTFRSFDADPAGSLLTGSVSSEIFGNDLVGIGDYNDDGFDDFLISIPTQSSVAIAYGNESGLITNNDLSYFSGIAVDGATDNIPVLALGDIDGDGISDIAMASTNAAGAIHVIMGDAGASGGDATRGVGTAEVTINAASGYEIIGGGAAGDFNGDGYNDLVVAMRDTSGSGDIVDIYVVYGSDSMSTTYDNNAGGGNQLNDETLAYHMQYQIQGHITPANFVINIDSAGDVNGDGFGDIMIGTPQADTDANGDEDGEVIVVYGEETAGYDVITDNDGSDANGTVDTIAANSNFDSLVGNANNNVMETNGFSDISMSAGAGDDELQINNTSFGTLDGGGGFDTLNFLVNGGTLDFTEIGSEQIKNIEAIEYGGANQTVVLGMEDLFDMMQSSTMVDGTDQVAQITSSVASNILVFNVSEGYEHTGVMFDNDPASDNTTEGGLIGFNVATDATDTAYQSFQFGNGYQLWISDTLLDNGNVVVADYAVLDGSSDDTAGAANNIEASDDEQDLIASNAADILSDGGNQNVSMYGFGGNDVLEINNGHFDQINGGLGDDTLLVQADVDLRSFTAGDIGQIENIDIGNSGPTNLSLTRQNIIDLLTSSDTGTLTINSANASDTLTLDDLGGVSGGDNNAIASAVGAAANAASAGYYTYNTAWGTLLIDQTLVETGTTVV